MGTLTNCCFAEGGPTPGHPSNEAVKIPPARAICVCAYMDVVYNTKYTKSYIAYTHTHTTGPASSLKDPGKDYKGGP